jgi:FlaA1/EpsC-like NDP-sugar epimerase
MAIKPIYLKGWPTVSVVCIVTLVTLMSRFIYQQYHSRKHYISISKNDKTNVAIIGAGQVGVMLANELRMNSKSKYNPYCFVDIDKEKVGNKINGIEVINEDSQIIEKSSICRLKKSL